MIIILIQLIIAVIHIFRLGQIFNGNAYLLYYSHFSDFILPFGIYFLLSLNEPAIPILGKWYIKVGIVFFVTLLAEICQFWGIEFLGVTFDPIDIIMYGAGVLFAAYVDRKIFPKLFKFWESNTERA